MAMENSQAPISCPRRIFSCARCRKRKIKCDRRLPNCTQCESAKAQCTGVTCNDDHEVPRSLIQSLESQIADWETELQAAKENTLRERFDGRPLQLPSPGVALPNRINEEDNAQQALDLDQHYLESTLPEFRSIIAAILPTDPALTDIVSYVRMGLTPSIILPIITRHTTESRKVPNMIRPHEEVDISTLATLPEDVIQALVRKYTRTTMVLSPILSESEVEEYLELVLTSLRDLKPENANKSLRPSFFFLIIYLVLSIASTSTCAQAPTKSRCLAFSELLFQEGIGHFSIHLSFPNDLVRLQTILLILQYAEINTKCANIWILNGAAMRICVELGLHREIVTGMAVDQDTVELRRRLFWAAYCMDRTISPVLQRPLYIEDDIIDTQLPRSSTISTEGGPMEPQRPVLDCIGYCRIQSRISEVHFHDKPLDRDWDSWVTQITGILMKWYNDNASINEAADFAYSLALVRVHRPSPRRPLPATESLTTAFEAACLSAKYSQQPALSGFLRTPWFVAHSTAESAMVALFCLLHAFDQITAKFSSGEVFDMTKAFTSNLLALTGHGWPEISNFAATFERLLAPLMAAILEKTPAGLLQYPQNFENEITSFLLPGCRMETNPFGLPTYDFFDTSDFALRTADGINWDDSFLQDLAGIPVDLSWDSVNFTMSSVAEGLAEPFG